MAEKIIYGRHKAKRGTTAYWNAAVGFIPYDGEIIVYTDYAPKLVDGEPVYSNGEQVFIPGIKIGSGNAFVQDLAFVGDKEAADIIAHISNTTIHVTAEEKAFWNNKVAVDENFIEDYERVIFYNEPI